jgi:arginine utilization protein RocB
MTEPNGNQLQATVIPCFAFIPEAVIPSVLPQHDLQGQYAVATHVSAWAAPQIKRIGITNNNFFIAPPKVSTPNAGKQTIRENRDRFNVFGVHVIKNPVIAFRAFILTIIHYVRTESKYIFSTRKCDFFTYRARIMLPNGFL